ncbi:hypothetical protein L7F22_047398 [Adiantum nelumboides]|nr:hypothetical protein [Adiantum nelumboides]
MAEEPQADDVCIREVWADNLEEEFKFIRSIVDDFPYLAMDTEFPGIVVKSVAPSQESNYQGLRANVNMLKLIQLGLTFSDESGSMPRCCNNNKYCVWQFNFREFNLREDVYAHDSIELLKRCGIDFRQNEERGIDSMLFAELMMSSGVVLNDSVHWITFHSAYDFGYLLKILTSQNLPATEADFLSLLMMYFPSLCDIKYLMTADNFYGGLDGLANKLGLKRIGRSHQSGSDSLLTSCCFRKLKYNYFNGDTEKYSGVLFGIGIGNQKIYR